MLTDPDTPAPVRFIAIYDNVLLGHAGRSRLGLKEFGKLMIAANGFFSTFSVDGFLRGRWELKRDTKKSATLQIWPFGTNLSKPAAAAVSKEAMRLLDLLAPDVETRDLVFLEAQGA